MQMLRGQNDNFAPFLVLLMAVTGILLIAYAVISTPKMETPPKDYWPTPTPYVNYPRQYPSVWPSYQAPQQTGIIDLVRGVMEKNKGTSVSRSNAFGHGFEGNCHHYTIFGSNTTSSMPEYMSAGYSDCDERLNGRSIEDVVNEGMLLAPTNLESRKYIVLNGRKALFSRNVGGSEPPVIQTYSMLCGKYTVLISWSGYESGTVLDKNAYAAAFDMAKACDQYEKDTGFVKSVIYNYGTGIEPASKYFSLSKAEIASKMAQLGSKHIGNLKSDFPRGLRTLMNSCDRLHAYGWPGDAEGQGAANIFVYGCTKSRHNISLEDFYWDSIGNLQMAGDYNKTVNGKQVIVPQNWGKGFAGYYFKCADYIIIIEHYATVKQASEGNLGLLVDEAVSSCKTWEKERRINP